MKSNNSLDSKNCRRMPMISACISGMSIPIKIFLNKTLPTCCYFCFTRLNSFITPYHFIVFHLINRTFHLPFNQHRNITLELHSINLPTLHLSQSTAAGKKKKKKIYYLVLLCRRKKHKNTVENNFNKFLRKVILV